LIPGCKYSPDPFALSMRLETRQQGAARPREEKNSRLTGGVAEVHPKVAFQRGRG
jgi:hypothetical protein